MRPVPVRHLGWLLLSLLVLFRAPAAEPLSFTSEQLSNGLRVVYAPLHQAPVVHVRVLYHVGSKDEDPARQGFAHMFEHMMFRGSAHVAPEEHMKLVGMVGGVSNAYTSFDETVYFQTLPSSHLGMALYLEADRMASFKVSPEIFEIERKVVVEEWRRQQNQPYGTFVQDFFGLLYQKFPYHWTPIGDMDDLAAAQASELQQFFNTYYLPNNAVLSIAGDFDLDEAKAMVRQNFGWIPAGQRPPRDYPREPPQTEPRRAEELRKVPLPRVLIGYKMPVEDHDRVALNLLSEILGSGRSSRLDQLLVNNADPLAVAVGTFNFGLEAGGFFGVSAVALAGKDPVLIEQKLFEAVARIARDGVTPEELEKAKTQARIAFVQQGQTAEQLAAAFGQAWLLQGSPDKVNVEQALAESMTTGDLRQAAARLLIPSQSTTLVVKPDPNAQPATFTDPDKDRTAEDTSAVKPRGVKFPGDWPARPPLSDRTPKAEFAKGVSSEIGGVQVIVMEDHRLPFVSWNLTMRTGSDADPAGSEGLSELTAELVRRGTTSMSYAALNEALESRGVTINVSAGGDVTTIQGSAVTYQADYGFDRTADLLLDASLPADEFERLKAQALSGLQYDLAQPETMARRALAKALWGDSVFGRFDTPESIQKITLDQVRDWYRQSYRPHGAILIISGDVNVAHGRGMARRLLRDWAAGQPPAPDYTTGPAPTATKILLVDRPDAQGSVIRMASRAYDLTAPEKYAGSLAGQILSSGINSRLGKHVRAEKGYAYSVWGYFDPDRKHGQFVAGTETEFKNTAPAIIAMQEVFDAVAGGEVSQTELTEAKLRAVGGLVMGMQTVEDQAAQRVRGILNGYPIDYYDTYGEKLTALQPKDIAAVLTQYVSKQPMVIVVVAPASQVKEQLEALGEVTVVVAQEG